MNEDSKNLLLGNGFNKNHQINTGYDDIIKSLAKYNHIGDILTESVLEQAKRDVEKIICGKNDIHLLWKNEIKNKFILIILDIISKSDSSVHKSHHMKLFESLADYDKIFTTNFDPVVYLSLLYMKNAQMTQNAQITQDSIFHKDAQITQDPICHKVVDFLNQTITFNKEHTFNLNDGFRIKSLYNLWCRDNGVNACDFGKFSRIKKSLLIKNKIRGKLNDGFVACQKDKSVLEFSPTEKMNFFHLHGSCHILKAKECNIKLSKGQNKDDFVDWLMDIYGSSFASTIVIGNDSEEKLGLIKKDLYLSHCYERLKKISGKIDVWGFSGKNDGHIISAMSESNLKKINYYYHPKPGNFKKRINKLNPNIKVSLFPSSKL